MNEPTSEGRDALVIGAGGGIGAAMVEALLDDSSVRRVFAVSRDGQDADAQRHEVPCHLHCDHSDESIAAVVAELKAQEFSPGNIVITLGLLHDDDLQPEKAIERLNRDHLQQVLTVNTVLPALWLSALTPLLRRSERAVVACLSARVGSIGDNHLGGWYSYRASKAALNMMLKTAAVEFARRARGVKLIAFHPGTTDTRLSKPFQARVPEDKLFTPQFVAQSLLTQMQSASCDGQLSYVDWAGKTVPW
ncbi:MAG: SDR family NAD(P)-dependent oxidoreductase [Halieaceae bacterium]|nr:SDR family NAD(P)-dependent oxidoreductase [Halieaceae bacterium]